MLNIPLKIIVRTRVSAPAKPAIIPVLESHHLSAERFFFGLFWIGNAILNEIAPTNKPNAMKYGAIAFPYVASPELFEISLLTGVAISLADSSEKLIFESFSAPDESCEVSRFEPFCSFAAPEFSVFIPEFKVLIPPKS